MRKWNIALAVVLSTLAFTPTYAQRPRAASPALTALDYYEIKQLYARFSHGLDSAADEGALFARVFTADGTLVDETGQTARGSDQLAALARSSPNAGPTNVAHYTNNVWIEPVPGGASGRSDVMIATRVAGQPRGAFIDAGEYWDLLVKTPEGWRIRRREFHRAAEANSFAVPSAAAPTVAAPTKLPQEHGQALRLTAQDYADIEQLYARYSHAFDSAADRGQMWANLFTTTGFHRNYPNQYILGRRALAEFAYDERGVQAATKTPLSALHFITQTMLESTSRGIVAKSYLMYVRHGAEGEATTVYPGGIYIDLLAKTPEGWRFQEKNVILNNGPVPAPTRQLLP